MIRSSRATALAYTRTPGTECIDTPRPRPRKTSGHGRSSYPLIDRPGPESAYSSPGNYALHQADTGHFAAQGLILSSSLEYVGKRIVVLGSGTGVGERALIMLREQELVGGTAQLRILGVDSSPKMVDEARSEMEKLLSRNPSLRECHDDGRLRYDYIVAKLGARSFADLDLTQTVIKRPAPDTFLAFMILSLWVDDKEAAVKQIAAKCRSATSSHQATALINGEEYPTHITQGPWMTRAFKREVRARVESQVEPQKIWAMLASHGLGIQSGPRQTPLGGAPDHIMHSAVLQYDR